ncbi:substrate-binding domain-containing protein, partial [Enterococcus innesii]
ANYEEEIAYLICKNLLENNQEITALFCASDIMAIGAIRGIKDMGLRVPEDISVIGFDDIILASYVTPELTTVAQDMERIGYEAAELLADIITNQAETSHRKISPHQLKVRQSVEKISEVR